MVDRSGRPLFTLGRSDEVSDPLAEIRDEAYCRSALPHLGDGGWGLVH